METPNTEHDPFILLYEIINLIHQVFHGRSIAFSTDQVHQFIISGKAFEWPLLPYHHDSPQVLALPRGKGEITALQYGSIEAPPVHKISASFESDLQIFPDLLPESFIVITKAVYPLKPQSRGFNLEADLTAKYLPQP